MTSRKSYVLTMWTGCIENPRTGQPILFSSVASAMKHLARLPSWGHNAVCVRKCTTRMGSNGKRDYFIGEVVS